VAAHQEERKGAALQLPRLAVTLPTTNPLARQEGRVCTELALFRSKIGSTSLTLIRRTRQFVKVLEHQQFFFVENLLKQFKHIVV